MDADFAKIVATLKDDPSPDSLVFLKPEFHINMDTQQQAEETDSIEDNQWVVEEPIVVEDIEGNKKIDEVEETKDNAEDEDIEEIERPPSGFDDESIDDDSLDGDDAIRRIMQRLSKQIKMLMELNYDRFTNSEARYSEDFVLTPREQPTWARRFRHAYRAYRAPEDIEARAARINPMRIYRLQKHLLALLHAHGCYHMEEVVRIRQMPECKLPICKATKNIIKHMQNCKDKTRCKIPSCSRSKRLMHHFRNCKKDTCPICKYFIKKNKDMP